MGPRRKEALGKRRGKDGRKRREDIMKGKIQKKMKCESNIIGRECVYVEDTRDCKKEEKE